VRLNPPKPEFTAALKNFIGGGGVLPAGTPSGSGMLLTGFVHVKFALQPKVTPIICEALVGNLSLLFDVTNVVDVIVRFQPDPEPRASVTIIGRL